MLRVSRPWDMALRVDRPDAFNSGFDVRSINSWYPLPILLLLLLLLLP
jgi:hypothetical protein